MISKKSQIEHFLIYQSVDFVPLSPVESEQVKTDWLATYALRVKKTRALGFTTVFDGTVLATDFNLPSQVQML
ncbi:hypothetical protein RA28_05515 [Ruegeria sp. ANG-S4]|nr:hypothetical protein RA28_05515 [Ruegeria sp. ANG-S4]